MTSLITIIVWPLSFNVLNMHVHFPVTLQQKNSMSVKIVQNQFLRQFILQIQSHTFRLKLNLIFFLSAAYV